MKSGRILAVAILVITFTIGVPAQLGADVNKGSWAEPASTMVPQYQIVDLGVVQSGDSAVQGLRVSEGGIAVGRSIRTGGAQAFKWTQGGGIAGLPNLAGRAYCVANGAADSGAAVGICSTSLSGTGKLPVIWENGQVTQLNIGGQTAGDANDVNASGVAVGSWGGGSTQRGVVYTNGIGAQITQTSAIGSYFVTAFSISDSGKVVGQGIDPTNAARNVGLVYDIASGTVTEVGALAGRNGALAFGVSNGGHVVGSSMQNQGSGLPYIWTLAGGMVEIPLPTGTTQGSARGVNSAGWAVGTASSSFAIPFLYDGTATYRLADLIPAGTGWDLSTNTSSSALGISENGVIVGTGVFNGQIHAYAMVPVAVNVSIGGRVMTSNGAGIRNATVLVSGGNLPAPIVTYTGNFGYYNVEGLTSGMTYTVSVKLRRYTITQWSQTVTPSGDVADINFIADPVQ